MSRYEDLPYGPDHTIVDDPNGKWFLVYNEAEGFQPITYVIQAEDFASAEEVWSEQDRNKGTNTEQVVVRLIEMPSPDYDSSRIPDSSHLDLSVAAREHSGVFTGWVYMGVEVVFEHTSPVSEYPAGIEDFAGVTARKFARRLRDVITPSSTDN